MQFIRNVIHTILETIKDIIGLIVMLFVGYLIFVAVLYLLCGIFCAYAGLILLSAYYPWIGIPLLILAVIFAVRCALRFFPRSEPRPSHLRGTVLVRTERHTFYSHTDR